MGRPRSVNEYVITDNGIQIVCKHCSFLINNESYEMVKRFKWFSKLSAATQSYYAYAHYKEDKKILLHRLILGVTNDSSQSIDHINGDTRDNRVENLRKCTKLENNRNAKKRKNCKSKYKGVTLRPSGRWGVYIKVKDKNLCLGTYDSEEIAAQIYNKAANKYFGEFAKLNKV